MSDESNSNDKRERDWEIDAMIHNPNFIRGLTKLIKEFLNPSKEDLKLSPEVLNNEYKDTWKLSPAVANALTRAAIQPAQLKKMTYEEILKIPYVGKKHAEEIARALAVIRSNPEA